MQCFESALMRDYVFDVVRELDPTVQRDDLLLDDLLASHGIDSMAELLELGSEKTMGLVQALLRHPPLAA